MYELSLESQVKQKEGHAACELDGEVVLLNLDSGRYFQLKETGKAIWEMISIPKRVQDLCVDLTKRFDVSESNCQAQTLVFLKALHEQNFIDVGDQ
ncbi:MAG: PqqD family peptide modification chaperone [Pseudomonadales bacterium]|nr:PqqD family peptide modification chaperone [Pseudomonadales bacterium]